jgi:hypothetical protein
MEKVVDKGAMRTHEKGAVVSVEEGSMNDTIRREL